MPIGIEGLTISGGLAGGAWKGAKNHAGMDGDPVEVMHLMAACWELNHGRVQAVMVLRVVEESVGPIQAGLRARDVRWMEPGW